MFRSKKLSLVMLMCILIMLSGQVFAKETISFMTLDASNFRPMLEQFISEFEAENPDVEIKPIFSGDLGPQAMAAVQSGNAPDILFIWSGFTIPQIQRGRFAEVPQFLVDQIKESVYQDLLPPFTVNGKLYAVPYNFYPSAGMIMYNVDLWQEAGLDPTTATTWDEFMEMAQKITKRDASGRLVQAGFSAQRDPECYFLSWLLELGGKPFNEDGTAAFNNELGRKAAQMYIDIYLKWGVDDIEFGLTADEFKKGTVGATMMGPWYGAMVAKDTPHINFAYFKQPGIEADNQVLWALREAWTFVVGPQAKNNEAVWEFLSYLLRPDVSARWSAFSGEIAAVAESLSYPEVQATPYLAPWMAVIDNGVSEDITKWLSEDVMDAISLMLASVIHGQDTLENAMNKAEKEINRFNSRLSR